MDREIRKPPPPIGATWRFVKAYVTTFTVIGSYLWLNWRTKLFGRSQTREQLSDLHRRNAERIEESILRLQGLFIKVGQLFSIMTNVLPEEFRTGLENLQDAVPARPFSQIERRIREEFGKEPNEVFASIEEEPIASASLGQVHGAMTKDGRKVAVKVQHIGVTAMAHADLKTIRRILGILKLFFKVRGLDNFHHEIKAMIFEELDFSQEARYIETISANFADNEKVILPRPIPELSTSRVLTLEYVDGVKVTDVESLRSFGLDPAQVARDLVTVYCQMIFIDGVYHADPHPGNILVQPDGTLVLLDFGAVGQLSPDMRQGISSFLEAIIKADEEQLLRSLRSMGFLQVHGSQTEMASRVIEHFHRKFQEEIRLDGFSLSSIQVDTKKGLESLADLRQMDIGLREISSAFHVPREWVLLERTALLLTGLCTYLDPEMNPADTIRPYLEEFVLGKDRDWSEMLFDLSREKLLSFLSLPAQIDKVLQQSLAGKITFQVEGIPAAGKLLYAGVHQLIYTFLATGAAGVGVYFHHAKQNEIAEYAGYTSAGFLALLVLSMAGARRHSRRL